MRDRNNIDNLWSRFGNQKEGSIKVNGKTVEDDKKEDGLNEEMESKKEEIKKQYKSLVLELESARIESYTDENGNLTGITKILVDHGDGVVKLMEMTLDKGKLVDRFSIKEHEGDESFNLKFNDAGQLDGISTVAGKIIKFENGSVVSVK